MPVNETNTPRLNKNTQLSKKMYEKFVKGYVISEENKTDSAGTISSEYTDKTILFGYLVVRKK